MRFYRPKWLNILDFFTKRLKIGRHCSLCYCSCESDIDLCDACESLLHRCKHIDRGGLSTQVCLHCGIELPSQYFRVHDSCEVPVIADSADVVATGSCLDCRLKISVFTQIVVPYRYHFPVDQLIQGLKYRQQRQIARVLGSLLARFVSQHRCDADLPDFLIPVPMHVARQATRGFNQADDIARWCAHDLKLHSWPGAAQRIVNTVSMAGLSRAARQNRILGAFRADEAVAGKRVAIVDDVLTTGSTARELARELYDTGALSVELWVLARTSNDL